MRPRPHSLVLVAILTVVPIPSRPAIAQHSRGEAPTTTAGKTQSSTVDNSNRDNEPPARGTEKTPAGKAKAPSPVVKLLGTDGKPIALPKDATVREFLAWLEQRKGPAYAVNSVDLNGTADDKRAELTATITVQILRDAEWVRIPLFLNEAQLSSTRHTFLGESLPDSLGTGNGAKASAGAKSKTEAAAAFSDVTQDVGYRWWFRGKGYHRLRLSLIVPVTKTVAQRRLRLKLPPMAAASSVDLRVDDPKLVVPPNKTRDVRVTRIGKAASRMRDVGLGSELDLQWRSAANSRGRVPILQAQTSIVVDFTEESVILTALQRVQVLGSINRIQVQLPAGYQALATGKFVKSYQVDSRNRATVEFTDTRPDAPDIQWTLTRRFPAGEGTLTLQGFDVDRAQVQSGDLAITKAQGLRVERLDAGNVAVGPIRPARFSTPDLIRDRTVSSAYRFVGQPFRLNLRVMRVQPQVTVEPTIRLNVSQGKLVLDASFQVEVSDEGGTVRDLEIHWPGWKSAGWKIRPLESGSPIDKRTLNPKNDAVPMRLRLMSRRGGKFVIPLSAERAIASSQRGVAIRLPVLTAAASPATSSRPATLIVVREPNLTLELTDRDEQPLTELAANPADGLTRRYRIADPAASQLTAHVKAHPQRLRGSTAVRLEAGPLGVNARQHVVLHVDYVRLDAVRFEIPAELAGRGNRIEFFDGNGRRLLTQPVMAKSGKPLVEIRLEPPMLGKIEIVAVAMWELPKELVPGESAVLDVPVVQVDGVRFSPVRVQSPADSKVELTLPADGWRRLPTLDGSPSWLGDASATSLRIRLALPQIPRSRPFSIPRALIRTGIDSAGTARYRAQYRLSGDPDAVVIMLPNRARLDAVYWGRRQVTGVRESRAAGQGDVLRIPVPTANGATDGRLLTVDYHTAGDSPSHGMAAHELVAPSFPENVWIEETVWQVILPRDRHLSSFGGGYTPEFSWNRTSMFWSRTPRPEFENPERWIRAADGPDWSVSADGNSYVFRRYGPASDFSVQSMGRSMIVLVGAGLAWVIGMLLVKLPRLRSMTVLLTAALAVAASGLWFASELQLLLQPGLLGAALAIGIVGIDRVSRRRGAPAVTTVAHPSEFVVGAASNVSAKPRSSPLLGSEDPTSIRPPVPALVSSGTPGAEPSSTASEARRQG